MSGSPSGGPSSPIVLPQFGGFDPEDMGDRHALGKVLQWLWTNSDELFLDHMPEDGELTTRDWWRCCKAVAALDVRRGISQRAWVEAWKQSVEDADGWQKSPMHGDRSPFAFDNNRYIGELDPEDVVHPGDLGWLGGGEEVEMQFAEEFRSELVKLLLEAYCLLDVSGDQSLQREEIVRFFAAGRARQKNDAAPDAAAPAASPAAASPTTALTVASPGVAPASHTPPPTPDPGEVDLVARPGIVGMPLQVPTHLQYSARGARSHGEMREDPDQLRQRDAEEVEGSTCTVDSTALRAETASSFATDRTVSPINPDLEHWSRLEQQDPDLAVRGVRRGWVSKVGGDAGLPPAGAFANSPVLNVSPDDEPCPFGQKKRRRSRAPGGAAGGAADEAPLCDEEAAKLEGHVREAAQRVRRVRRGIERGHRSACMLSMSRDQYTAFVRALMSEGDVEKLRPVSHQGVFTPKGETEREGTTRSVLSSLLHEEYGNINYGLTAHEAAAAGGPGSVRVRCAESIVSDARMRRLRHLGVDDGDPCLTRMISETEFKAAYRKAVGVDLGSAKHRHLWDRLEYMFNGMIPKRTFLRHCMANRAADRAAQSSRPYFVSYAHYQGSRCALETVLLLFILFIALFSTYILRDRGLGPTYYQQTAIENHLGDSLGSVADQWFEKTFWDIGTEGDFWPFLENMLVRVYGEAEERGANVSIDDTNNIVGGVLLQQWREPPTSCASLRHLFKNNRHGACPPAADSLRGYDISWDGAVTQDAQDSCMGNTRPLNRTLKMVYFWTKSSRVMSWIVRWLAMEQLGFSIRLDSAVDERRAVLQLADMQAPSASPSTNPTAYPTTSPSGSPTSGRGRGGGGRGGGHVDDDEDPPTPPPADISADLAVEVRNQSKTGDTSLVGAAIDEVVASGKVVIIGKHAYERKSGLYITPSALEVCKACGHYKSYQGGRGRLIADTVFSTSATTAVTAHASKVDPDDGMDRTKLQFMLHYAEIDGDNPFRDGELTWESADEAVDPGVGEVHCLTRTAGSSATYTDWTAPHLRGLNIDESFTTFEHDSEQELKNYIDVVSARKQAAMFTFYSPSYLVATSGAVRISGMDDPETKPDCVIPNMTDDKSKWKCDYPSDPLLKLVRSSVADQNPDLIYLVNRSTMTVEAMQQLLEQIALGETEKNVACNWIKANQKTWKNWIRRPELELAKMSESRYYDKCYESFTQNDEVSFTVNARHLNKINGVATSVGIHGRKVLAANSFFDTEDRELPTEREWRELRVNATAPGPPSVKRWWYELMWNRYRPWMYQTCSELGGEHLLVMHGHIPIGSSLTKRTYGCDGYGAVFPLSWTRTQAQMLLHDLKSNEWIDIATRGILVEFYSFNQNSEVFLRSRYMAEVASTGAWTVNRQTTTFKLWLPEASESGSWAMELVYVGIMLAITFYFTWETMARVKTSWNKFHTLDVSCAGHTYRYNASKGHGQCFPSRYTMNWTTLAVYVFFSDFLNVLDLINYPMMFASWALRFWSMYQGLTESNILCTDVYPTEYGWIGDVSTLNNLLDGGNCIILYIRLLYFLRLSPSIRALLQTLDKAAANITSLFIGFFIIMIGFTLCAWIVFGNLLEKYNGFDQSFTTLFFIMLGEFDYDAMQKEMPVFPLVFFILFFIIIIAVLFNLIIAVIGTAFDEVNGQRFQRFNFNDRVLHDPATARWGRLGSWMSDSFIVREAQALLCSRCGARPSPTRFWTEYGNALADLESDDACVALIAHTKVRLLLRAAHMLHTQPPHEVGERVLVRDDADAEWLPGRVIGVRGSQCVVRPARFRQGYCFAHMSPAPRLYRVGASVRALREIAPRGGGGGAAAAAAALARRPVAEGELGTVTLSTVGSRVAAGSPRRERLFADFGRGAVAVEAEVDVEPVVGDGDAGDDDTESASDNAEEDAAATGMKRLSVADFLDEEFGALRRREIEHYLIHLPADRLGVTKLRAWTDCLDHHHQWRNENEGHLEFPATEEEPDEVAKLGEKVDSLTAELRSLKTAIIALKAGAV